MKKIMKKGHVIIIVIAVGALMCLIAKAGNFENKAAEEVQDIQNPSTTNYELRTTNYDFTDSSHWNLTVSAWEHLAAKDFEGVYAYGRKCLELYEAPAKEKAKQMTTFAQFGHEDDYDLVNDVATAHYVMGEAYMKQDKFDEALQEFNLIIAEYPYAQCWDPKGWFWKVADISKKNIEKIGKFKKGIQ